MFFVPLFLMNTFFILRKSSIFSLWKKTIPTYLFLYLIVVLVTPWKDGDVYLRIAKDLFALYISVGYLAFSLIFIAYKASKKL